MEHSQAAAAFGADLSSPVYLAFCTGSEAATPAFVARVRADHPELEVIAVYPGRPFPGIAGRTVAGAAVHATKGSGAWGLRVRALRLAGSRLRIYNDNLDHFQFGDWAVLRQHLRWRWSQRGRGRVWYGLLGRLALMSVGKGAAGLRVREVGFVSQKGGITVIVPSRDGRELLQEMLPAVLADLPAENAEVVVVDNGSSDGTAEYLRSRYREVRVECSADPLSFAAAVNRGIGAAQYSHVVLLNNDMQIEPGFFASLRAAFDKVPNLFCATAQIFFPAGQRREETGLCYWHRAPGDEFPIYCAEPQGNEDGAEVLYGSGGCSMYSAEKLRALGGFDEQYQPAYVEDLDIGYRAWLEGWPTVYCAGAKVEHRHRATTSRYYDSAHLDYLVERNYLRFLVSATGPIFDEFWPAAIRRLRNRAVNGDKAAQRALRGAWREGLKRRNRAVSVDETALKAKLTL